jgi:hypothetical protein
VNTEEMRQTIGVLEALAVAIQNKDTWYRVASWNGSQRVPYEAVADLLRKIKPSDQIIGNPEAGPNLDCVTPDKRLTVRARAQKRQRRRLPRLR